MCEDDGTLLASPAPTALHVCCIRPKNISDVWSGFVQALSLLSEKPYVGTSN